MLFLRFLLLCLPQNLVRRVRAEKFAEQPAAVCVRRHLLDLILPAPYGCAPWDITYTLLEEWPGVTIDVLRLVAEENMAGKENNDVCEWTEPSR